MARAPFLINPLELDRVALGDPLATRDALYTLWAALNAQATREAVRIGAWKDVPYTAADFQGLDSAVGTNTWTVDAADLVQFQYLRIDDLLLVHWVISNSTIPADGLVRDAMLIKIPGGFIGRQGMVQNFGSLVWSDSVTVDSTLGFVQVNGTTGLVTPLGDRIECFKSPAGTDFVTPSANNLSLAGFALISIESPGGGVLG